MESMTNFQKQEFRRSFKLTTGKAVRGPFLVRELVWLGVGLPVTGGGSKNTASKNFEEEQATVKEDLKTPMSKTNSDKGKSVVWLNQNVVQDSDDSIN